MGKAQHYMGLLAFIVAIPISLFAQTFAGQVTVRVFDSQSAAVANAGLVLKNSDTGAVRIATTTIEGQFTFALVPPGIYTIRAEATGFAPRTLVLEVSVAETTRMDITLNVRELRAEIVVEGGGGVAVQTENAELGNIVNQRQISELPSLTRNPYDFVRLSAGANPSNDGRGIGYAVNGQRSSSGNFILDGGENNDTFVAGPGQAVPLDAVEEYRVQTNNYTSEYGRNAGFIANVVTKAGTGKFHGSLYEFNRNSALAANSYDNKANGLPRPVFNRNQFGGTLGGPVRQEKLFFFVSIEPIRVRSRTTTTSFVPTPQLLAISSPGTQAIFQRFPLPTNVSSTVVVSRTLCPYQATCDPASGSGFVTIPAYAQAVRAGNNDVGAGTPQNTYLGTGRLDCFLSLKTQLFVRYAIQNKDAFPVAAQPYGPALDSAAYAQNQNIALDLTRLWSSKWATESRIVYNRVFGDPDRGSGVIKGVPLPPLSSFRITTDQIGQIGIALPKGQDAFGGPQNLYQFFQTVSWMQGAHAIKFGGQFIQLRDDRNEGLLARDASFFDDQAFVNGVLQRFTLAIDPKGHFPGETLDPPFGPPNTTRHYRYNEPALFIEDTWRITPRFTLNPGLRWEYFGVLHSPGAEHQLDSNFYLGASSNLLERIATGKFLRTEDAPGDLRGNFYRPQYANFAPRLGLAYDIFGDGKTVFRSGAGIFYDRNFGAVLFNASYNPPNLALISLRNVILTPAIVADQFAAFSDNAITLTGVNTRMLASDLKTAYTVSWNATFEREIAHSFVAAASYVGSSGSRLYSVNNINRTGSGGLLDSSCVGVSFASDGVTPLGPDYTNCPNLNLNGSTINERGNFGHSSYHALQLRFDSRRIARLGLEFGANYTWSRSIDNNSSVVGDDRTASPTFVFGFLDAFNARLDKGPSDFDQTHRFVAHFVWDLPFGRQRNNAFQKYITGGWGLSGVLGFQSGQPFSIGDNGVPDLRVEVTRPRVTGALPKLGPLIPDAITPNDFLYLPINQVYDPNSGGCLADAAPFACEISVNGPFNGTLPRNTFRRPGTQSHDIAFLKNIPLRKEGNRLQFRAEFYNVFNHPNLYINQSQNDVAVTTFNPSSITASPGVTAHFQDDRQIVVALKLLF